MDNLLHSLKEKQKECILLKSKISTLERENTQLNELLSSNYISKKELIALKNFTYNSREKEFNHSQVNQSKMYFCDIHCLVIGRDKRWLEKIKKEFKHFKTLTLEEWNDGIIFNDYDYVFISSNYLGSPLYKNFIHNVTNSKTRLIYLKGSKSIDKTMVEMYRQR